MELEDSKSVVKVFGLDPSLNNFGVFSGLLDLTTGYLTEPFVYLSQLPKDKPNKSVRQNSKDLQSARFHADNLRTLIVNLQPDIICVEIPVGSQSARSMASYGICIGIIAGLTTPLIQVTPIEVKLAAVGSKTATKSEMIKWAVGEFPEAAWLKHGGKLTANNEHIADALGAIYAGVKTDQFKLITSLRK